MWTPSLTVSVPLNLLAASTKRIVLDPNAIFERSI